MFIHPGVADAVPGSRLTLAGSEARHAATVQRRDVGEHIDLVDGEGARAACVISAVRDALMELDVLATSRDDDPPLVLVQALAKGGRDEQALESATELGATRIVPWAAQRSIVLWKGPKAAKARDKWASLALAATKQSRRATVPSVDEVVATPRLAELVGEATARGARVLVLHERSAAPLAALEWADPRQEVWVIVGPEGGIADDEVDRLRAAGGEVVLLGPHVLRASTAGPAAIAALSALRGAWSGPRPRNTLES